MSMVVTVVFYSLRMACVGRTAAATHLHFDVMYKFNRSSLFLGLFGMALRILWKSVLIALVSLGVRVSSIHTKAKLNSKEHHASNVLQVLAVNTRGFHFDMRGDHALACEVQAYCFQLGLEVRDLLGLLNSEQIISIKDAAKNSFSVSDPRGWVPVTPEFP